jgi:Eco57I restriction-modification methylase/restriction endonuclease TaqI-like protein
MATSDITFDEAFARVSQLSDYFDARRDEVMAGDYKEATARAEFITPFFEALGWDVNNAAHRTIYDKDVILEKAEAHAGTQRSADYAFRKPGTHFTAFFVEAKKPNVDIRGHNECYQAVLYGWNASTPLVVLTDFEQFLILDARSRPDKHNASSHILSENGSYTYRDYRDNDKFTEIWGLFSRQAVANGSIEKAAAALPKVSGRIRKDDLFARGTRPVDDEFLAQIELWREILAKSLKRSNNRLDGDQLTSITQRILDRLVFLRFLEDRLIERDVTFDQISKGGSAWKDFQRVAHRLDARYNGIIYKNDKHGIDDPRLVVADEMFAEVVEGLDPHNSDYLFGSIPVTILGSIYERFLGKEIISKNKTAEVVWKPENLKKHGVYYTPAYIVEYIVEQTVGRCISGKTPRQIEAMRFADIACGSGSFLVEVFSALIRYHLRWYLNDGVAKWTKRGVLREREGDGDYVLTLAEKRRILLNNVYGIDIDAQAVEVTQLSLYLRLLENESFPSTQLLFDAEHRALLPDLRNNVVHGNSIVETDISDLFGLSPEDEAKIRPLDIRYAFKAISASDGRLFDAVVGNPPYGGGLPPPQNGYVRSHYATIANSLDTFLIFCERAISLLKPNGFFGYIIPSGWASTPSARKLRQLFVDTCEPTSLVMLPYDVFPGAYVDTMIVTARRFGPTENWSQLKHTEIELVVFPVRHHITGTREFSSFAKCGDFKPWANHIDRGFLVTSSQEEQALILKLLTLPYTFNDVVEVMRGIEEFHPIQKAGLRHPERAFTGELLRYQLRHGEKLFIDYDQKLQSQKPREFFDGPRILLRQLLSRKFRLQASLATDFFLTNQSIQSLISRTSDSKARPDLRAVLAILNSQLISWFFCQTNLVSRRDDFPKTIIKQTREFPFPDLKAVTKTSDLLRLADRMLNAQKSKHKAEGSSRSHWTRQIESIERQIDQLVYGLYELTEAEIALVEGGNANLAKLLGKSVESKLKERSPVES